jgi:SAM-dependent MidA family methyltransferase
MRMPTSPADARADLPLPDAAAQAHSARLIALIRDAIAAAGGRITLARYLELVLYAPGLGYYSAGSRKFGPAGDFVTAPEISPLFSRALARQVAELLQTSGGDCVLEAGAGSGVMAADLLAELETLACLPARYDILELSGDLRARQRATLSARVPHLLPRVHWRERLPTAPFNGVVLANELLDALPAHGFRVHDGVIEERYVTWTGERFAWAWGAPSTPQLAARLAPLAAGLPSGYASEINPAAEDWVRAMAAVLARGAILLLDYGFPRREFYHPQRDQGTLMCHYRHRSHPDPFLYPGLQDITTHVDFTAIAEAAHGAGLTVSGYTTQAAFLLANGIAELAQASGAHDERARLQAAQQVRTLTQPEEMGELFKVMALTRGIDTPLRGFALLDQRHRL